MQAILGIILSAILSENFILVKFYGICPFMGVSKKIDTALGMGMAVTFVMAIASDACYAVNVLLVKLGLDYMQTVAFILVIAAIVQVVEMFLKKSVPALYKALGVYLPLITTNCAVLGVVLVNVQKGYNFLLSVVNGAAGGLGFTVAIVLFASVRERVNRADCPACFKGFPIALISAGLLYDGDAWDLVLAGRPVTHTVPLATVLTLPATGSEMNSGAVISRHETKEKYPFYSNYPLFSILDPEVTFTLPPHQVACGLADTFVHVMEQYMTTPRQSRVMDRWAEGLLQTLIEIAPKIRENQHDYQLMADFMLSATMALNGFIAMGVSQDWATHMIGHEITALHGLTHGHTLAIVLPATLQVLREAKGDKLVQYGERVWGITSGTKEERIDEAIRCTEQFFRSLGLTTRLHEENIGQETILEIERRFNERGVKYGENGNVTGAVARKILETAL